jgi:hypothetical protein
MEVAPHLKHLYAHLVENKFVEDIRTYTPNCLSIYATDVLKKIESGDASWEKSVPPGVADVIKKKRLFGYGQAVK